MRSNSCWKLLGLVMQRPIAQPGPSWKGTLGKLKVHTNLALKSTSTTTLTPDPCGRASRSSLTTYQSHQLSRPAVPSSRLSSITMLVLTKDAGSILVTIPLLTIPSHSPQQMCIQHWAWWIFGWFILNFLTYRLQSLKLGNHVCPLPSSRTLCIPQGCMLSPLFYSLFTHQVCRWYHNRRSHQHKW